MGLRLLFATKVSMGGGVVAEKRRQRVAKSPTSRDIGTSPGSEKQNLTLIQGEPGQVAESAKIGN
jgi:hypothetical protein